MKTPRLITPWKKPLRHQHSAFGAFGGTGAFGAVPSGFVPYSNVQESGTTPIAGWMEGHSVPIGTMLRETNWGTRGIYRDDTDAKNVPPGIDQYDYMIPIPFIHVEVVLMISMGVYREESKVQDHIRELYERGIGYGPNGMTLMDWANALSLAWYGRRYDELNLTGVVDPMGDFVKRANVRTAMATMSWTAWMAMQVATSRDMQKQNAGGTQVGTITAGAIGSAATVATAAGCAPCAIVLGIIAAVVQLVVLIIAAGISGRINDILAGIAASGVNINPTDRATMCALYTMMQDPNFAASTNEEAQAYSDAIETMTAAIDEQPGPARLLFENCQPFRANEAWLFETEDTSARLARVAATKQEENRIEDEMNRRVEAAQEKRRKDAAWESGAQRRNKTVTQTVGVSTGVATVLTLARTLL